MSDPLRKRFVQFGCGTCAPAGWDNFDCSPTLWLQRLPVIGLIARRAAGFTFPPSIRYGDIVQGLPLPPRSVDAMYCSHVLEHLSYADLRRSLRNTRSYLVDRGIFRLVLPDLRRLASEYVASRDADAACRFMRDSSLGVKKRRRGFVGLLRQAMGNATHLWMWDFESLSGQLHEAGFGDIRRAQYHDSCQPSFIEVESRDRWDGQLGIECRATHG